MPSPFPEETVKIAQDSIRATLEIYPKHFRTAYKKALGVWTAFKNSDYGFLGNLRTGVYAPYIHEKEKLKIGGYNCTTIIPDLYLSCEILGINPQIVQFFSFRDIEKKDDLENPFENHHFSIIVDAGRKHKYLLDPFWKTFGPIIEENSGHIKIAKCDGRPATKREFREMKYHSAEEFAEMMDRLHDPAESLDMLVAGQKVLDDRVIEKIECEIMVYYNDETNTVSTRICVPQALISNKAVTCNMQFNDSGEIVNKYLELFLMKERSWTGLIEGKKIAQLDFSALEEFRKTIKKTLNENGERRKHIRIGRLIDSSKHKSCLAEIINSMPLTKEEK